MTTYELLEQLKQLNDLAAAYVACLESADYSQARDLALSLHELWNMEANK